MDSRIVENHVIYEVVTGSTAYHLNTPASDLDVRGIFIPPPELTFGLNVMEGYRPSEDDREFKSLREAFHQWSIGTINWLELLWVDNDMVRTNTEETHILRSHRTMFTSKRAIHKAIGFMNGMIRRSEQSARTENPNIHKEVMHGVRLGYMINDFMDTNILSPNQEKNREHLLSIKNGTINVADATAEIVELVTKLDEKLPSLKWKDSPNEDEVNTFLMNLYFQYWNKQNWWVGEFNPPSHLPKYNIPKTMIIR